MRIALDDLRPFDSEDEATYRSLRRLFEEAALGKHDVDAGDHEGILASGFAKDMLVPADAELVARVLGQGAFLPAEDRARPVACVGAFDAPARGPGGFQIPAERAGEWAQQPLTALLENDSDALLLELCAAAAEGLLPVNRVAWALKLGWLEPAGCGGTGELRKRIAAASPLRRLVAICDSDRDEWAEEPAPAAAAILEAAREAKVPVHCLRGRERENYPPRAWVRAAAAERPRPRVRTRSRGRLPLLFERIVATIENDRRAWDKKFSRAATEEALARLRREATRSVPARTSDALLAEYDYLDEHGRMMDDHKARFGERVLQRVEERVKATLAGDTFDPASFGAEQRRDLLALCLLLERWL